MQKIFSFFIAIIFIVQIIGCGTNTPILQHKESIKNSNYTIKQISDSLFSSRQKISLLTLAKKSLNKNYMIELGYDEENLITTSQIANKHDAIAAINGGFFNMDEGGSVSYFEINDSVIGKTRNPKLKWGVSDSIINGAIILTRTNKLILEQAAPEAFYKNSKNEKFVLFTGPILISHDKLQKLPDMKFANKRHPRTCLGITKDSIILVTIDGRSKQAAGMSLNEAQQYLSDLGCIDAINLDGGGSTTMWTKSNGIVNRPSDKKGERKVANALLILESPPQNSN